MTGKGPRIERETVINFNEVDPNASVWTASESMYHRMKKAGYQPIEDNERSATFEIPKKLVAIRKPRKLSQLQRKNLAQNARFLSRATVITEAE